MDISSLSQVDMMRQMIDTGETLPSQDKGYFNSFKAVSATQIYNLIKQCATFSKLDLEYSNEPLYYIMRDARITLVSATAGAGKTTLTCMKVDREIRFMGRNPSRICVLSFNNDSVRDIKQKMTHIIGNNNIVTKRFGISLDEKSMPNIRSLNSLTYNIVDQFKEYWNLAKVDIITPEDASYLMTRNLNAISNDTTGFEVTNDLITNCLAIYDLMNETCCNIESLKNMSFVLDTNLPLDILNKVIEAYKSHLIIQNKFHHSDTARLVLERCLIDEKFREDVSSMYDLIVIDELQDISEVVFRLLKILIGDKNRLIAIGDGDQSIYSFKGARHDTCFRFKDDFPEAVLCTLSVNRRCAEQILEYAKVVIGNVKKRIPQELKAIHSGGELDINHYTDSITAVKSITDYLTTIPTDKLGDLCIGFRKNVTCYYIAQKLMEAGIPFRVRPDMMPGADKLSQHFKSIFAMLKSPSNMELAFQNLHKLLPIKKLSAKELKKFQEEIDEYFEENDLEYFYEIPVEKLKLRFNNPDLVTELMSTLEKASNLVRKRGTMKEVTDLIFPLFEKYYWNFTRAVTSFQPELERMVIDIYSKDETYIEFQHRRKELEDNIQKHMKRGYGIKLSSFHSLKGLEFDEVFLVELDSKNLPLIRCSDSASEEEVMDLVDEELRLFYVAVTRAKKKLHLYWSSVDVSIFEEFNNHFQSNQKPESEDDLSFDFDFENSEVPENFEMPYQTNPKPDLITSASEETVSDSEIPDSDLSFDFFVDKPLEIANVVKDKAPIYNLTNIEDNLDITVEKTIHIDEDFVNIKNGNELQNVLNLLCNVVKAEGV